MILLALVITVQAGMQAHALTMATLIKAEKNALHKRAIGELVRGDIAMAILQPGGAQKRALNGQIYTYDFAGKSAQIRLQDVAGIVDIYQSGAEQLPLAGFDSSQVQSILKWRETSVGDMRHASIEQTLSVLGFGQKYQSLLTQSRQSHRINPMSAPVEIRAQVDQLPPSSRRVEQPRIIRVMIEY